MKATIYFVAVVMLLACNNQRRIDAKAADQRLRNIEQLLKQGAYDQAKNEIDSIHALYPRLVDKRKAAQAFMDSILCREAERSIVYCDSLLALKRPHAEALEAAFKVEKDETYQTIGSFVHPLLRTEVNAGQNFLKVYTDEEAVLYVISYYVGSKQAHRQLKATSGDLFAESNLPSNEEGARYTFTDNGVTWEMLTFKDEEASPLVAFIAQQVDKPIKITLKSDAGESASYFLSTRVKKAIAETYNFWIEKRDVTLLEREIAKSKARIETIRGKQNKPQE